MKRFLFVFLLIAILAGCKEGQLIENLAPDTKIFLDSIALSGDDRLNSFVSMHWSGEDQDGYVTGFELSFDNIQWDFVTTQDTTFRFDLDPGTDSSDIDFWVRAIDNKETKDQSPAYLRIPIKNTPPTSALDSIQGIPDTVYSVFSALWRVNDIDGLETLDSTFIKVNEGAWYALSPVVLFVTIVPVDPTKGGIQEGKVYTRTDAKLLPFPIESLNIEGDNIFYLRTRDIAGTFSKTDTSENFFIKAQSSSTLIVDDHPGVLGDPHIADRVYAPIFANVHPSFDLIDIRTNVPPFWNPTFGLFLELYDKVFWYSDGQPFPNTGDPLLLEVAANQIQLYLNQGGKILITLKFPTLFNNPDLSGASPIYGFSPADSVSSSSGQARLLRDSLVESFERFEMDFPTLLPPEPIAGVDPFYSKNPVHDIYFAHLTAVQNWRGSTTVCGRTIFNNGKTNQVFFSLELHRLNGDPAALEAFFDQVLNKEFDW